MIENLAVKTESVPMGYFDFKSYLEQSLKNPFVIDLENADLKTVIQACVKVKKNVSPKYGKTISCLIYNIKYIEKTYNVTLYPVQITDIFWSMFIGLMQQRGLKNSTISTMVRELRAILRWGTRYNVKISPSFDVVRIPAYRSHEIALSADDVSRIYHFDIQMFYRDRKQIFRDRMERVRDMFALGCNLYQRFSDLLRISKGCFDRNIFTIVQQKTGNIAKVNLDTDCIDSKMTYDILEKYNYEAPFKGDISNFNHYLKELMRDIGFTDIIHIEEKVNGEMVATDVPKWKMISSHTCRRTACTLAVLREDSTHNIKKRSGHSSLDCLERYILD